MGNVEEQSETNREEKSESSGQEETISDGEEQIESDGEEQEESNGDEQNEEQHMVINEAQPSGQATEVGNTIHVQPMSEATRDDLPVVTLGYSPIHMSIPSTMYGPEARQSEKVDWCTVKAYIDQQFSLMGSKISLLPSKIIMSLQQQNIHVEGKQSPHSERQHTHDDVEGESHQVVRENPKRVSKRSHYLEPPYTDPFHYTKAHRGDHIQYDPLRNIDSRKQKKFDEHLKSGESINCGLGERTIIYFQQIIKEHEWLFSEDAIILDEKFPQLVTINFKSNPDMIDNELSRYISSESPHLWGKNWKGAKELYMTLNIKDHHWVTVKADIQTLELIVYDYSIGATTSKKLDDLMLPLHTMISIMLRESLQFQKIAQCFTIYGHINDYLMGDCAVYAIKFIEFDMAGLSFESLSDDRMSFYRKKMTLSSTLQMNDNLNFV
ncbi:hypothetical protein G4B88_008130 [Cannabis sativa]|uniref:Ubiquitin-like protease family profile domain-containing protein n=1 Tax=Cannabis sativa TaxID=3483 RepID=A0A7J6I7A6_CANSA|nr:hypothetical protein G4B88_008130 [Cannabis sativa]